ncbi:hypothetical protein A2422_00780 [Candidatus Woesebacteria bacterium RIFOXYC1_FULL_31_51]|uniref:7 transmembrane helices usually fused to an inactive transglutaminase domain-containing protein n=1 Tax=Candidatus Woesebacteria bacterium GW2011_GWC2_31_9 TaxID=1618586 RepID=A0A0F9Z0R6_9BACT|nr:MAG: hypothetical protein UR17_C0001G0531 [Candidatus Woesebacteria bacterium GW2011_GWF1_31_35]KKP22852.1 MAG: hypothetical protein UR11_C0002G0232 [Candidatus Woesebacteria bacterium GW2011_GWC1_30_29]KKP26660.1 MAG: hypothetical protein UR13_C0003G0027 [Candidatus Woesebacteria bacterium GW2011_GWD1_31_12]KKP28100.1 MAG: hypothetical protein UR16_C0001G0121 [Candidatus Woesebacteria bacterium GW2011_GWB1_31_29]KKP32231.1 MAG: hypothetical protein UR21_C0001G0027 [Candidatus Woesebacteria 
MKNILVTIVLALILFLTPLSVMAKTSIPSPTSTPILVTPSPEPVRVDITQKTESIVGPLEMLIEKQQLDKVWPTNPIKYAIKSAVNGGVPANTIVLLLLLPIVATLIAGTRQIIGIRGFGIFLPAALSVTFVAIGPVVGILLFIAIVAISTIVRLLTRKLKLKLQYLPRMALILWFVSFGVLGILFASPIIKYAPLANVSIFPVLVLTLLVEDFTRIQLGKSVKTAVGLTSQTLILALISYLFLTFTPFQRFVLLNPEISLGATFLIDIILGKYIGLRFLEYRRFKKLINSK